MIRRYAVVRGATAGDLNSAIETDPPVSLDATRSLLSTESTPASVFVGDAGPFAVIEYTSGELRTLLDLPAWTDWTNLDASTKTAMVADIAAQDIAFGVQMQGVFLVNGWSLQGAGVPMPIENVMHLQLDVTYAAAAASNGAPMLLRELLERVPTHASYFPQATKDALLGMVAAHLAKWPRAEDVDPKLPPQIVEQSDDFTLEVYIPAYYVDASGGPIEITLPPRNDAGVLPYWYTRIKIVGATVVNTVTFTPDGAETVDGAANLVVAAPSTVVLGGTSTQWRDMV